MTTAAFTPGNTKERPMTITKHCQDCGGENVYFDATAAWHPETGKWTLRATQDASYCDDCDAHCQIIDKEQ